MHDNPEALPGTRMMKAASWPELLPRDQATRRLTDLLALGPSEVVAAVGAGGKSSFLERLALDYEAEGARVILTSTTLIRPPASGGRPLVTAASLEGLLDLLRVEPPRSPVVGWRLEGGKLRGLPPDWIPALRDLPWVRAVLVEADGAIGLPLKAPSNYEPVLPAGTSLLVALAGLDAVGTSLEEGRVHRPSLLAELLGVSLGTVLSPGDVLLAAERAYQSRRPLGGRFLVVLNKTDLERADDGVSRAAVARAAAALSTEVWAGSARTGNFVELKGRDPRPDALVLAAGLARRMGGEKLLESLAGRSMLGRAVAAVSGHPGIGRVVIVTGEGHARAQRVLRAELPSGTFSLVRNDAARLGQSASLKRGVSALERAPDLLVLLADQPFVTPGTVGRLLRVKRAHPRAAAVGLAPREPESAVSVRPPLVLHRSLLPQLLGLSGDQGARPLLARYPELLVSVPAEGAELLDIDTPSDWQRALAIIEKDRASR